MSKTVVLLSGGMDSTVLAHYLKKSGAELRAISFNYGQRHQRELHSARAQASILDVPYCAVELQSLAGVLPGSSQTDPSIELPTGHYTQENMKATVVPNRNMILLAIAIGHAIAHGCDAVAYAAHAGDHAIYPDCRPVFADAMQAVANVCDYKQIRLDRPFIHLSKAEIAGMGRNLGVDFSQTWSCYAGSLLHCGKCGTCIERREAFYLAGVPDPTQYAADAPDTEYLLKTGWLLGA